MDRKNILLVSVLLVVVFCLSFQNVKGQSVDSLGNESYKNAIDFCPLSPMIKIWAVHYTYRITPKSEIIAGPLYMNIPYENIGHTDAPGFIIGYRQYLWKNLHIDYQLMPAWDRYYEQNEKKRYPVGFDLWNEFRLGYSWDFNVARLPCFINVQWPFGFALYSDGNGKPQSFKDKAKENPFFYFPPLFFIGVRF